MALRDRFKSLFTSSKLNVRARFELLREAISGSMSQVYMARDRDTDRVVALKILDIDKTIAFENRFRGLAKPKEGEMAVQFDHPYIVKTYEHGITTEGAQYLVMEFLEGAGMNSLLIAKDELLNGRRVKYIRQIAQALAVVHKAGFIHRDVCPRNLLLTGDGETLKLTDFGLSVPASGHFLDPGNRTGTAAYMAPELVHRQRTDQRLDIFAFGVSAYEMCTFHRPWTGGITGMAAMTHDQPPADIFGYRPQINPVLAEAIQCCIEADPDKRCPSMDQFLPMIRRVEHEDGE